MEIKTNLNWFNSGITPDTVVHARALREPETLTAILVNVFVTNAIQNLQDNNALMRITPARLQAIVDDVATKVTSNIENDLHNAFEEITERVVRAGDEKTK
jgi:hypothetical protein